MPEAATTRRSEAKLLLIGIPVFLWTMLPIYYIFLFSFSTMEEAFAGKLWPDHPTLRNFGLVLNQENYWLNHFWLQLWNSLMIALAVGVLTLFIATAAAFAISRLKARGGRLVMNLALFTYFIPAAFLAVPMYKAMGTYGLLNTQWALILAMVLSGSIGVFVVESQTSSVNIAFVRCVLGAVTLGLYCLARGFHRNSGLTPGLVALAASGGVFIVLNWIFLFQSFGLGSGPACSSSPDRMADAGCNMGHELRRI